MTAVDILQAIAADLLSTTGIRARAGLMGVGRKRT